MGVIGSLHIWIGWGGGGKGQDSGIPQGPSNKNSGRSQGIRDSFY